MTDLSEPAARDAPGAVPLQLSYLVCATPRSGSSLLCEMLEQTGLAGHPQEYFWRGFEPAWSRRWGVSGYPSYLHAALSHGATPNGVFGAKIMWAHLDYLVDNLRILPDCAGLTARRLLGEAFPNLHYVWIIRRDTVRQAVSLWKAAQTMAWNDTGGEPGRPRAGIFSFGGIDRLVQNLTQRNSSWDQYFRHSVIQPKRVFYEDLERDPEGTTRSILAFLGIDVPPDTYFPPPRLRKQADRQSEAWVTQYEKIREELDRRNTT